MDYMKNLFWGSKPAKIQFIGIIVAIIVLAFCPTIFSSYTTVFLASILTYVVMSVSWTIFSGKTGYISLASAAFYGLGTYMEAVLGESIPLPIVMVIAAIVCFAAAFGIGIITLRLKGVYFTIFTFALALFLQHFVLWYEVKFTHTKGRMVMSHDFTFVFFCVLAVFAIVLFTTIIMNKSKFGLALDCIGQNEESAAHVGVNTTMIKVLAFAISTAPVGAVGAAMATRVGYIDPDIAFNMLMSFMPVLMAIFGGMHHTFGPVIGAIIFTVLEEYLLKEYSNQYMIIFGVIMVVAIILMPKGIIGIVESSIDKRRKIGGGGEVIGSV
jgi:branched-chain amino acid transport system permease protein